MKKRITIWVSMLVMLMITAIPSFAVDADLEEMRSKLPKMLGANNVGTEFYMSFIVTFTDESIGGASEIRLFISSAVDTEVYIERKDKGFLKRVTVKANDITFVDIPPTVAQPYTKMGRDLPLAEEVIPGGALHVVANDPVIIYGMTRIIHASEGFLAIPVSSFGKEYINNTWNDPSPFDYVMGSWSNIVTAYDKTTIRFKLGGEDWTETGGGKIPGSTSTFNMNAGDVVCIGSVSKHGDVTGSVSTGNKPFGVLSGVGCAFIPTGVWACDMIVSMELPTNTWGTEYHVTKIDNRDKASYMKVVSKESATTIYRDGLALGYIPKSGGISGQGWLVMRTTSDEFQPRSVIITGDKPISITQFNPGGVDDGANSDPFQMVLTSYEQYQDEIIFNTPGVQSTEIGFDYNFINIVYEATEFGTIPDDLMLGKVVDGKVDWKAINVISADPGEEFVIKMRGKRYFMKTYQLPGDGVYKIKALKPFTAYAYGMSNWDTYGYPTSVALGDLSIPDTVAPDPQWDVDCFGNFDGTVKDMPDEAAYRSNLSLIYMESQNSYNFKFEYAPFIAGETRETSWNLEVIDKQQEARAVIVFTDRRGNDTTIMCEFFPTLISIHEDEYNFGRLAVGESAEHTFWVVNDSKVGVLDLTQLKLLYGTQGFEILNNPIPIEIQPLDSVEFIVKFTATEEGMYEDSIGVGDPCFFWYKAYVQANVGAPRILVSRYDFGDVTVDESKYGIVTVENIGSSALEIYSYTGPELKPVYEVLDWLAFQEFGEDPTPLKPWIIKPGIEKTFEVKFTPDVEGIFLDSVVFTSNTDRPVDKYIDSVGELTGTGIKAYLVANGYDWLRRRIDRPGSFDVAPYDVDAPDKVIFLENKGTTPVQIKNIKISEDVVGDAFEFDRAAFVITEIDKESDMYVPVKFHPVATGVHTLRFTYDNTATSPTETLLQGIGIVPRLETEDMDFAVTYVNDYPNVITKTIPITNLSQTVWEYCDSVTVTDLTITPAGAIATTITGDVYGSEGFRFNIDALRIMDASGAIIATSVSLPVTLQPGEYIEVDAEFVATRPEQLTASITTVSDAETDQKSVWTGAGFNQDVIPTATTLTTCVYDPQEVVLTLTWTGAAGIADIPITVEKVEITNPPTAYTFKDPIDNGPFVLAPGATRDIVFIFDPLTAGTHTADVTITSDIPDNRIDNITLTADAVHYDRSVSVRIPTGINRVDDDHQLFEIGDLGTIYLQLDAGPDISMAQITTMNFTVAYEPEFIKVIASGIKSVAPGYALSNVSIIKETGEISFDLNGPAFTNQGGLDLVEIQFGTYLPKTDKDNMDFVVTAEAGGSRCVDMTATGSNVEVMKTCVYDLRKVQLSGTAYMLKAINPNPVKVSTDINFSIGLETQTTIEIYNSAGELVARPIDKILTSGQYSVNVPVSDLPSGTYRVVLRSGPFTEQQSMIIVK